jgi:hypothetical protein
MPLLETTLLPLGSSFSKCLASQNDSIVSLIGSVSRTTVRFEFDFNVRKTVFLKCCHDKARGLKSNPNCHGAIRISSN